ncbi:beta strand repeat-containing protein, partial [Pseudoalteromonas sp. Angola-4]|uniref:beta strand repeat-containing protein n=1 Tax=Pseudoalteromonas sp. Angola-4 TaxID=3025335 RepID=UPI002359E65D
MENISKAVVIVELLSDVWVVMDNGDWVKVDSIPEQFADLPVLNSSDIALEGNELVFSEASEQLVVPQDIISQLVSDLSQNSTFDARSNTSSVTSLSSSDANEAQVAYQLIARQGQELVPESGYETTPTETTEEEDPNFIEFRPDPIFTVGQLGGDGVFINKYDAVALEFSGTVENVPDGSLVQIVLSDSDGNEIIVTTEVQDGVWSVTNIDITALNDGEVTATVSLVGGNEDDAASETKVKDTQADIFIDFEDGLNTNQPIDFEGEVQDVQDGQLVTVTIFDAQGNPIATYEATVTNGQWSVGPEPFADLPDGNYTIQVSTIDEAGNDTQTQKSFSKDTTAIITIDVNETEDGVINNSENVVQVSGTVEGIEDGQTVLVTLTDIDGNEVSVEAVVENGQYQLEVDISSLSDGEITATAQAQDLLGNESTASQVISHDKTAQLTVEIDSTQDGVINSEEESNVTVRGVVTGIEDGQTVTVVLSDGVNPPITLTAIVVNGSYEIAGVDISSLNDGTISANATAQDISGNPASASDEAQYDSSVATSIVAQDIDGVINSAEQNNVQLSGSVTDIEPGQLVTVTFTDSNNQQVVVTAEVDADGNWQISGDIESLADGEISAQISIFDAAGNEATQEVTFSKDTQSTLTLNIDKTEDGVINGSAENTDISLSGIVNGVEDGQEVTIIFTDSLGNEVVVTAIVENGNYALSGVDISALNDGDISVSASVLDTAGNTAVAEDSFEIDNSALITASIDKTDDGVINGQDDDLRDNVNTAENAGVVVRGTVEDVEDGQIVTVTLSDGINPPVITQAVVQNGQYVTEPMDATGLNDGTMIATAEVADAAGNPISAQDNVEIDTTAAITTSIDKTADSVINGSNENQEIVVRGTVSGIEDGQVVTITLRDGVNPGIAVQAIVQNGEYVTAPIDASSLNDGDIVARADVSDLAGNEATARDTVEIDKLADITTNIDETADGVINGSGESAAIVVRGTVEDIEDGQIVTVTISDGVNPAVTTTATVINGEYVTTPIDASSLNDGTLTATASVSDIAGNPVSAQDSVELDNTAAITTSIDKTADGVINGNGESAAMVVRGTVTDVEDGQTVTVILSDGTNQVETTALVQN